LAKGFRTGVVGVAMWGIVHPMGRPMGRPAAVKARSRVACKLGRDFRSIGDAIGVEELIAL
jgi:hypothetical protein